MSNNQQQVQLATTTPAVLTRISTQSSCVRVAEVAGGTAAECAVICCCFPCGILNLAVLALYKVPAGICRKIFTKKQRRTQNHPYHHHQQKQNQNKLLRKGDQVAGVRRAAPCVCGCEADRQVYPVMPRVKEEEEAEEVKRLEKEMWDTFCSTGFWRSPSQRHRT